VGLFETPLAQVGSENKQPLLILQKTHSYFHFVTEIVPLALSQLEEHSPLVQICKPWQIEVLRAFNLSPKNYTVREDSQKPQLVIKKDRWGVYPVEGLVQAANSWLLKKQAVRRKGSGPVYLVNRTHHSSTTGRVLSEDNAELLCATFGATQIEPASLHPRQQFQAFTQASALIGPHGSAFANLIAAQNGTVVGEIDGPTQVHWHVERLCRLLDLDYRLLLARKQTGNDFVFEPVGDELDR